MFQKQPSHTNELLYMIDFAFMRSVSSIYRITSSPGLQLNFDFYLNILDLLYKHKRYWKIAYRKSTKE